MSFTKAGEQGLYQDWLCCLRCLFLTGKPAFYTAICLNRNKLALAVNLWALSVLILSRIFLVRVTVFKHLRIYYQQIVLLIVHF
jgi:hypothetical protein